MYVSMLLNYTFKSDLNKFCYTYFATPTHGDTCQKLFLVLGQYENRLKSDVAAGCSLPIPNVSLKFPSLNSHKFPRFIKQTLQLL